MRDRGRAFTLVELLVVIGIVSLLVAILLPTLAAATAQARLLQCASNERQLLQGLATYAAESRGKLPPNVSSPGSGSWWSDATCLGVYIKPISVPAGQPGGPVYTCPNDDEQSHLSYCMNVWASSKVDASVTAYMPPTGNLWSVGRASPSKLLLIAESYSWSVVSGGYYAKQAIGFAGSNAGDKFGGGAGISPPVSKGRFGLVTSELTYMRHRKATDAARGTRPIGTLNIGYADGHVESKRNTELVNSAGNSTGDTLWCPTDAVGP